MTNKKISELTALTAPASTDILPIVDVSRVVQAQTIKLHTQIY